MRALVSFCFATLAGCGGAGSASGAGEPTHVEMPNDDDGANLPREVREGITVLQLAVEAMAMEDMDMLRAHADPEIGTWYWDNPGEVSVPCTWLDPLGDEDPFAPELQQCSDAHLLAEVEPVLRAALDAWEIDRGAYDGQGVEWGSFDREADLSVLREAADLANATRSVRRAIDGQPIEHAFRAERGGRSIIVYMTVREEAPYMAHVISTTRR